MRRFRGMLGVGATFGVLVVLGCDEEKKAEGPPPPPFEEVPTRFERPLNAVWVVSPTQAFAVGGGGLIVAFDGTKWAAAESPTTEDLLAIWGSGTTVRAVGSNGTIATWDGSAWSAEENVVATVLRAVCGSGPDDVWAFGDQGHAVHFDGEAWTETTVALPENLEAAWLGDEGTGFFVGFESASGVVTGRFDEEDGWTRVDRAAVGVGAIADIQGRIEDGEVRAQVWGAGANTPGNGVVVRWEPNAWVTVPDLILPERPKALEPTDEGLWLGGASMLVRVDPAAAAVVEKMTLTAPVADLHAVDGLVVAVGGSSDGRIWTRVPK